ncbi:MAG: hypothetical protein QM758_23775 [Armatimonas sp.]
MSRRYWLLAFCSTLLLTGCGGGSGTPLTISRGVAGIVYVWEGDFREMPLNNGSVIPSTFSRPRLGSARGLVYTARRQLELHPYSDTPPQIDINGFVEALITEPVAVGISDDKGVFQVEAPPGRYRVYVREGDRLWLGRPDLGLSFVPIEVREDSVATVRVDVTWGAIFR